MKKIYLSLALALCCAIHTQAAVSINDVIGAYSGTLTIGGTPETGNIIILPGSATNRITLVLPDFTYMGGNLGDIVVANIQMSTSGNVGINNYVLYLSELVTHASISSDRTTSKLTGSTAALTLTIQVPNLPNIPVSFSGNRVATDLQLPNAGFEENWHTVNSGVEPDGWHSFESCTAASNFLQRNARGHNQLVSSSDVRPGSTGSTSALIKAYSIIGVIANGNLTSGQIHAGSTSPTSTDNHAFSNPTNTGYNTPFTAQPDSFVFWAKFIPGNSSHEARMHSVITTNARYQDPEEKDYSDVKIAEATLNYKATNGWKRLSAPFVYSTSVAATEAAYILNTFSTNKTPGVGSESDQVYLDDIELIYNYQLDNFTFDGSQVSFNNGTASVNKPYSDSIYTYSTAANGKGAKALVGFDGANNCVVVYVLAADFASQPSHHNVYSVQLTAPVTGLAETAIYADKASKVVENGQIYILRGEKCYDLLGKRIR